MAANDSMNRLFQTAGSQKPQTGTGYTNLNRFFQANKNNQLGQKVSGNLQSQVGGIQSQLGEQKTAFEKEAEKNRLDTEANKQQREQTIGRFADPSTSGEQVSDDDIKRFQSFIGGQYAGPSGLRDTSALASQASELRGQTSNLTPAGTQELLRRSVGGTGRYTQGQQRLDSLLMDRSGLKQVGREAAGLYGDINRANLAAQGQAQALKNQAQQFGTETKEALNTALTGLDTAAANQLATAQAVENERLSRIQAIQDFAAGKTAKRDAQGNIVKDQYGNTVYETTNPRGSTNAYAQMDQLRNLLQSQGAQPEEIEKLLGSGNFTQGKSTYDKALNDIAKQQAREAAAYAYRYTLPGTGKIYHGLENYTTKDSEGYPVVDTDRVARDIESGKLDPNTIQVLERGEFSDQNLGSLANLSDKIMNPYIDKALGGKFTNLRTQAANDLYGTRGIAGEALKAGSQEAFYSNLAKVLSNSQAAQGLTQQGVASDALRQNYTALQQLLGQTSDLNKYKDTDQRYQAGQFLLNPDLIRKATIG